MKAVAPIPLSSISRLAIVVTNCRMGLDQTRAMTGADYILNGGMWNADGSPCRGLKVDGKLLSATPWGDLAGYGWNTPQDIKQTTDWNSFKNYICTSPLIVDGKRLEKLPYDSAQGGARPRSAIGIVGDSLLLYCTDSNLTPENLADELEDRGCSSAMMLDGGGSSQCNFDGKTIRASRLVHNWICVWTKKTGTKPPESEEKPMSKPVVCLDPGHGPGNVNGSPDGSYKEREFTWDMYTRLKPLLEAQGVTVVGTRPNQADYPSLTERAAVSNKAGADLFVSIHSNAAGNGGWYSASGFIAFTSSGPDSAPRNKAASAIINEVKASGIKLFSTSLAHERYTVLVKTDAPAVLLECAFHTNEDDVANLKSDTWRDKLAKAVCDGVCDFLGLEFKEEEPESGVPDQADQWAQDAWEKAHAAGIMDGARPRDNLTRQEAAVLLARLGLI